MDNQASQSICKIEHIYLFFKKKSFLLLFITVQTCLFVSAQTTTNPLTTDITITASVIGPTPYPDTPPGKGGGGVLNDAAIFKGVSYPGSVVSLLQNGIIVASIPAKPDGSFEIHMITLPPGTYSFGIRAEDSGHIKSKLLLFTVYISTNVTTIVDGIFIPPTITSDKIEVKKGENIILYGRATPLSDVRISVSSVDEVLKTTKASSSGEWSFVLDSSDFSFGDYVAKARSITPISISLYGEEIKFEVGLIDRVRTKSSELFGFKKKCDLNDDGRVNLLDFSIMAFWYKRLGFPERVDLNTDNKINLTDLSILAFCWTG